MAGFGGGGVFPLKPAFGAGTGGFGAAKPAVGGFGAKPGGSIGAAAGFGAAKPLGGPGGFGGLANPASPGGFGAAKAPLAGAAAGATAAPSLSAATAAAAAVPKAAGGMFGAKPAAAGFGTAKPASSAFGAAKPASPAAGFGAAKPLGGGFGAKPASPGGFGGGLAKPLGGAFGGAAGGGSPGFGAPGGFGGAAKLLGGGFGAAKPKGPKIQIVAAIESGTAAELTAILATNPAAAATSTPSHAGDNFSMLPIQRAICPSFFGDATYPERAAKVTALLERGVDVNSISGAGTPFESSLVKKAAKAGLTEVVVAAYQPRRRYHPQRLQHLTPRNLIFRKIWRLQAGPAGHGDAGCRALPGAGRRHRGIRGGQGPARCRGDCQAAQHLAGVPKA